MNKPVSNPTTPASTNVITGVRTRLSYLHVNEPQSFNGGKAKYSTVTIIPKTDNDTVSKIQGCIRAAYQKDADKLKNKGVLPPFEAIRSPLRDGDLERPDDPAYAGCWFISAKSDKKPEVVDQNADPMDAALLYSGCYARVAMNFYAYNTNGNRGITAGLNGIQFVRDGEPLGSHFDAQKEFGAIEPAAIPEEDDFLA